MLPVLLMAVAVAGAPSMKARIIEYHGDADIVPVSAQIGFVTEVQLPNAEIVMSDETHAIRVGSPHFFRVNATENILYIEPQGEPSKDEGRTTTVNITTTTGKHLGFFVTEISKVANAHADLKLILQFDEDPNKTVQTFVPASQWREAQAIAEEREMQMATQQKNQERIIDSARMREASLMNCAGYELFGGKGNWRAFNPSVCRDDKFVYIHVDTQEAPTVWELKDGSKDDDMVKVDAPLRDGCYIVQHLVDEGELKVGKSSVKFRFSVKRFNQ